MAVMQKYKFITIAAQEGKKINDRPVYWVTNNSSGERLAILYYYPSWRQFVAQFDPGSFFNNSCLTDITDFLTNHAGQ